MPTLPTLVYRGHRKTFQPLCLLCLTSLLALALCGCSNFGATAAKSDAPGGSGGSGKGGGSRGGGGAVRGPRGGGGGGGGRPRRGGGRRAPRPRDKPPPPRLPCKSPGDRQRRGLLYHY